MVLLYLDYNLAKDKLTLKKGKWPEKDYEVMVNYENRYSMPLNKTIDNKINEQKLKVVGYYQGEEQYYLISPNTLKYNLITKSENITIYPKDKELGLSAFRELGLNIKDTYENAKKEYKESIKNSVVSTLVVSGIIIAISLIEIFLMIRSSFLSRIKEIGILELLVLRKVIFIKMFRGEIIAITTIACLSGIALMVYIIYVLREIDYFKKIFMLNPVVIGSAIVLCYIFNLFVGLIPVFNTLRKHQPKY